MKDQTGLAGFRWFSPVQCRSGPIFKTLIKTIKWSIIILGNNGEL